MAVLKMISLLCITFLVITDASPISLPKRSPLTGVTRILNPSDVKSMFSPETFETKENSTKGSVNAAVPFTPMGISHRGGPIMSSGVNVYIVWYGSWVPAAKNIVTNFISSLGPQNADVSQSVRKWWKINGLYYDKSGRFPSQRISVSGQVTDNYSYGRTGLTVSNIVYIVYNQMSKGTLPLDTNGIYLVLTSADVSVS